MSIDFFCFDQFKVPSALSAECLINCKLKSIEAAAITQEGAAITITGRIEQPQGLKGQDFLIMLKAVQDTEVICSTRQALGFVSLISGSPPESEKDQMSGTCIEIIAPLYELFWTHLSKDLKDYEIKLLATFPPYKPTQWCAMGLLLNLQLERENEIVAAITLDDLRQKRVRFED